MKNRVSLKELKPGHIYKDVLEQVSNPFLLSSLKREPHQWNVLILTKEGIEIRYWTCDCENNKDFEELN